MNKIRTVSLIIIFLLFSLAQTQVSFASAHKLSVAVNQSQLLTMYGVERVAVANPEIADVVVVSGTEILLVGKSPGITNLHIWSGSGRNSYIVEVGSDNTQIAGEIKNILGYPDIRVSKVNKSVILEGTVNDQYQKIRAEKVASAYGDKVVNLLEITRPIQVKIEARIIEINRANVDNLGIKWGNYASDNRPGTFLFGQGFLGSASNPTLGTNPPNRTVLGGLGGYMAIDGLIDALVKDKIAKILSQPNLITLSGEKANIIVGGQIPVPVSQQNGSVMIDWKDYGIKLEISPEVNSEGLISSKIKAEVSTLDWASDHQIGLSAGMKIPPLLMRKAESTIALLSGQTMAIGGLIATETTKDVYKVPLLADIPILGKLFTSKSFNRGETELIILITPTIVNPQEYTPKMSKELEATTKEDPWGGKKDGGKNQSTGS